MKTALEDLEIVSAKNQLRLFGYGPNFNFFIKFFN